MEFSLSAELQILIVMLGLQLIESVRSADRGGLSLLRTARGFRVHRWSDFQAVPGRRHSTAPLLPPLYEHLVVKPPPWTTDGRFLFAPAGFDMEARPPRCVPQLVVALDTLEVVHSEGTDVFLDGRKAYSMGDEQRAQQEAIWLADWAAKSPADRRKAFRERRLQELAPDPLLASWRDRLPVIDRLRCVSSVQWVIQWLIVPVIVWRLGFQASMIAALPLWWLAACGTSVAYLIFGQRHGPVEGLTGRALSVCICPPLGFRLQDRLWQPLVTGRHPLAVARALLDKRDFQDLTTRWLRDLEHPPLPTDGMEESRCHAFNAEAALIREWLGQAAVALPRSEVRSGARKDAQGASRCPRCLAPHTAVATTCQDCAVPLAAECAPHSGLPDGCVEESATTP